MTVSEGSWKDGKLNGAGSVTHDNGERYQGDWKNDLPNGHGVLIRADGSKLEGEFAQGKFTGAEAAAPDSPGDRVAGATPVSLDAKAAEASVKPPSGSMPSSVPGGSVGQEADGGGRRSPQPDRH